MRCARTIRRSDQPQRDELGLDKLSHIGRTHQPVRRLRYSCGYLLKGPLAIGLFGDAVEKLRDLQRAATALDKPLSLLETYSLHLADKLDVRRYCRALGHF